MESSRIKLGAPLNEPTPAYIFDDLRWLRENRNNLLQQYGECVILIHNHEVVGYGETINDAVQDAENKLSPDVESIMPIIEVLKYEKDFMSWLRTLGHP